MKQYMERMIVSFGTEINSVDFDQEFMKTNKFGKRGKFMIDGELHILKSLHVYYQTNMPDLKKRLWQSAQKTSWKGLQTAH